MDKKTLILDALNELFLEGNGGTASVSDIAKKAGIAKGGLYYYFKSKDEVVDALVEREYKSIIENADKFSKEKSNNSIERFKMLYYEYSKSIVNSSLDKYLHLSQNAAIHQKSLAFIVRAFSKIVKEIIDQGVEEGTFVCKYPDQVSEFIVTVLAFLFDDGIFDWSVEEKRLKLIALSDMIENYLQCTKGTFSFLL